MSRGSLLIFSNFLSDKLAVTCMISTQPFHLFNGSFSYLFVPLELGFWWLVRVLRIELVFTPTLCEQHFPFSHVIHGLILMGDKVPLHKGTVLHVNAISVSLLF